MSNFKNIQNKLEAFTKRYYTNELLKGIILFFAMGLLYLLFTLFIEYMLWLNPTARAILFWLFVVVELALFVKYIAIPLARLFKLQKGINFKDASRIIGKHFPEVNDKLLNVLQLNDNEYKSELLLASVNQKSLELDPIPFKRAINFKKNLGYLKYAALPVLILVMTFLFGNFNWFSDSYERVLNYQTAYEPPAPFQFFVVNNDLNAIENKDFKLLVKTVGEVVPEDAQIAYNNEIYFLQQTGIGQFEYVFSQPHINIQFRLSANGVTSKPYEINVVEVPSLLSFEMVLDYPGYTNKKDVVLKGTGNAIVPEGTTITWQLKTKATKTVNLYAKDTLAFIGGQSGAFKLSKPIFNRFDYRLSVSNNSLRDYENLAFSIDVVKDEYPELNIKVVTDSLDLQTLYFYGQISDDYGISKVQLVYYRSDNVDNKKTEQILVSNSNMEDFYSSFPNNLEIEDGVSYDLYFQVFDNDLINKFKSVKSNVFSYRKRTGIEETQKQLNEQSKTIKDLSKTLDRFDVQEKQLEEIAKTQREKTNLNFNDKKKLESFIKRQKQQDEMMKSFNEKLKQNLEAFKKENVIKGDFKEDLKDRLNENEQKLKQDEKLLDEIEKLQEKINKEELSQKLEELAKQNKNKKRSLEQLLELTKRFYVEKKLESVKNDLEKLAKRQEDLSKKSGDENTKDKQDELNEMFGLFKKDMETLEKDSKALKKPIAIPRDKLDEREVDDEQQKASGDLEKKESEENQESNKGIDKPESVDKQKQNKAKESQKKAAQKMKQMSAKMQRAMSSGGGDQIKEDAEMLRQILDNLVLFSFDQERLMVQFNAIDVNHSKYASYLRNQNSLKTHFEHVDDSLFALSLRQPKLSEQVNNEITEVYYNMDKALSQFAESQIYLGVASQQFAITASNNLASFLSDVLDNMEESMNMASGKGGEGEMQLPDIIMSQEQLSKIMEEGMKKGEEGKPKEGEGKKEGDGKDGDGKKENDGKKEGEQGKDGLIGKMTGDGEGSGEDLNKLLYEIYQQQQMLRQALEEELSNEGKVGKGLGLSLVRQMENIELDLLNNGFTNQTLQKMLALKHQLMKLENAAFQQGEDDKRESETNLKIFNSNVNEQVPSAKQYFKTSEILNRQALPLQQIYKKKVQDYFKANND